jgi:hypothetical protein
VTDKEIIEFLKTRLEVIKNNDKSFYDCGTGKNGQNRFGKLPEQGRWLTPFELADEALIRIDREAVKHERH